MLILSMISRVFLAGTLFFGLIVIFGLYAGALGQFSFFSSAAIILAAAILSGVYVRNKTKIPNEEKNPALFVVLIAVLFALLFVIISLPEGVFPVTCSDFYNHARTIRVDAANGGFENISLQGNLTPSLFYLHSYPNGFYALSIPFFFFLQNSYLVATILAALILILILFAVYSISHRAKISPFASSIAVFFAAFSITSLWILELGFLPQLLGSLFLLSALYAFMRRDKVLFIISTAAMITYPPLLGIEVLFLIGALVAPKLRLLPAALSKQLIPFTKFFSAKEALLFIGLAIIGILLVFPETIGLLLQYGNVSFAKDNLFLIRGGIYTPNFFGLLPFLISIAGLYFIFGKKEKYSLTAPILLFILCSIIASGVIVLVYALNYVLHFSFKLELTALYQAVKYFYFLLIALSIPAGVGAERLLNSRRKILRAVPIILMVLLFIYFVGYLSVLSEKRSEPFGYYGVAAIGDTLPRNSVLGIDSCMLISNTFSQPWAYQSLIDRPDTGPNLCRQTENTRAFQFSWANYNFENSRFRIYSDANKEVLLLGDEVDLSKPNVDYFITNCRSLDSLLVKESFGVKLYKVTN